MDRRHFLRFSGALCAAGATLPDVVLPGAAHGPVPFLMYPNGETSAGRLDSLDPDSFSYTLSAKPDSI